MEAFPIEINNQEYSLNPLEEKDQVLYEVYGAGGLLCVIGLNEDGDWEANNEYPNDLILKIGNAIESHEI